MTTAHNLGFPRFGARREMKHAVENYWKGTSTRADLERAGAKLRARHWAQQARAALGYVPVGDFSWYDHVLDTTALLGCVPPRFGHGGGEVDLDTYFRMARGRAPSGEPAAACEMTKWFDTNYHYIVPELRADTGFRIGSRKLFEEVDEAKAQGVTPKPVLLGPLTWLLLGKIKGEPFERLALLERLVPVYDEILQRLAGQGVAWLQVDEPALVLDLDAAWREACERVYGTLGGNGPNLLLTTYFGGTDHHLALLPRLPVQGLHVDAVRAPGQLAAVDAAWPKERVLSVGIVDGRNVWRTDLEAALDTLEPLAGSRGENLWVAPSCSLLHVPLDLEQESDLDPELKRWLAFAVQKLDELAVLQQALEHGRGRGRVGEALRASSEAARARKRSHRIHKDAVRDRVRSVDEDMTRRDRPYRERAHAQRARADRPLYPTTTIGSFPQTGEIRKTRRRYKRGEIGAGEYTQRLREEIRRTVERQDAWGLDVLVHGEAERNDMVEYFGEQLEGFAFTENAWVQSFGSRGVKPPIIYGDVQRPAPMTVDWITYAQSLTDKPMKGMLTGPVTILKWSFPRDDVPASDIAMQIALALRDEVQDLERAGIGIIQIDEPAFREGLPLRRSEWREYLAWATRAFRAASSGVRDDTQIHTHMCYSEFNDIIEAIAALDADVITIETSRSDMELLDAFVDFEYPNELGPGVYDIHSPNVLETGHVVDLIHKAAGRIPRERLWINPDCGLKTRDWPEVEDSLRNMVRAAQTLRDEAGGG